MNNTRLADNGTQEDETKSNIYSENDFWRIEGVLYKGEVGTWDLLKKLLDNGNKRTQEEWAKFRIESEKQDRFFTGDMSLYHSIFKTVYNSRNGYYIEEEAREKERRFFEWVDFQTESDKQFLAGGMPPSLPASLAVDNLTNGDYTKEAAGEIRAFLEKQFREKHLATLTRIKYAPISSSQDEIIHNFGLPAAYSSFIENFAFYDGLEKRRSNYLALLGSDNLKDMPEVYKWMIDHNLYWDRIHNWMIDEDPYLVGIYNREDKVLERVVTLHASSNRLRLSSEWRPDWEVASLGVRFMGAKEAHRTSEIRRID